MHKNQYNQPIGEAVLNWKAVKQPSAKILVGESCLVEKIQTDHYIEDLFAIYNQTTRRENWTYLPIEPFATMKEFAEYYQSLTISKDPYHYAIVDKKTKKALGTMALMRIDELNGSVEVGFVIYSDALKHTKIATEAQYLLAKYVFEELGYRRYEWKCDALNHPSEKAALRLGFQYEGCFRQAVVYKGRNRDTKWFSILDKEWPLHKESLENWLVAENFDNQGQQLEKLETIRQKLRSAKQNDCL